MTVQELINELSQLSKDKEVKMLANGYRCDVRVGIDYVEESKDIVRLIWQERLPSDEDDEW